MTFDSPVDPEQQLNPDEYSDSIVDDFVWWLIRMAF